MVTLSVAVVVLVIVGVDNSQSLEQVGTSSTPLPPAGESSTDSALPTTDSYYPTPTEIHISSENVTQELINMPAALDKVTPEGDVSTSSPRRNGNTSTTQMVTMGTVAALTEAGALTSGNKTMIQQRADQLVQCHCGSQEVLMKGKCQPFPNVILIDTQLDNVRFVKKSVTELNVIVQDLDCNMKDDHREMMFTEGQFYLRTRGDIVLSDTAGYLSGLRINNYCVSHSLDEKGNLASILKACVPPPSIPRCCPVGEALSDGVCSVTPSPPLLLPPLSAGPFKDSVQWPVIRNHYNPLNCTEDPMKTLLLGSEVSHLVALPTGVIHTWVLSEDTAERKYTFPPEFCVDGRENLDGSLTYTANLCYSNPEERHHRICDGNICVRKCCNYGQIMDTSLHRCVHYNNTTFTPPINITQPYKTVFGFPLCVPQTQVTNFTLDETGHLIYPGRILPSTDYCIDTFHDGKGKIEDSGLACLSVLSEWDKIRVTLLPACHIISLVFLCLTVLCYIKVPELLNNGGWYQLWHVLSLMVAYACTLCQRIFNRHLNDLTCVILALVMQLGYLAAFFWLSVLCFEVWRKVKSLSKYLPSTAMPVWVYPLFAFGGPFMIGIITACMQYLAPDNVPGILKPYIGEAKCWFRGELELFLYFYGPITVLFACNIGFIGHTYWNFRKFDNNTAVLRNFTNDKPVGDAKTTARPSLEHTHRRRNYISDFKQQFSLLVLMSTCWVAEILSWKIPPPEMWAVTDIMNTLQGFFIFLIFLANASKRKHLKNKYPGLFVVVKHFKLIFQKTKSFICGNDDSDVVLCHVSGITSQVSRKISGSSIVSNISTLTSSLNMSSDSSFHVTSSAKSNRKRPPSVSETENGIVVISHSSLCFTPSSESDTSL
nr:probable G-protein coupled receptor Mth-like 1 [Cherax quadricarinatus]